MTADCCQRALRHVLATVARERHKGCLTIHTPALDRLDGFLSDARSGIHPGSRFVGPREPSRCIPSSGLKRGALNLGRDCSIEVRGTGRTPAFPITRLIQVSQGAVMLPVHGPKRGPRAVTLAKPSALSSPRSTNANDAGSRDSSPCAAAMAATATPPLC